MRSAFAVTVCALCALALPGGVASSGTFPGEISPANATENAAVASSGAAATASPLVVRPVPPQDRRGVPEWTLDPEFAPDAFTFVRIRYRSHRERYHRLGSWATDWPDSDLNFSFRLQQLTALDVDPDGLVLELDDPRIFDYPFLYMIEPGEIMLDEREIGALRRYCLNGGFLMVDDFWGDDEWQHFYGVIKRVFPEREPLEVPLEHEIFHIVYDLAEKPQIPSINSALRGRGSGRTWERGSDTRVPHYRAIHDDQQRIMVFICHNTDLGDGWEREGENEWYFQEFSEKKAYPMGINIVIYALTH